MKKILFSLSSLLIVYVAIIFIAPVQLGRFTYNSAVTIESSLYGLDEQFIDIGEMKMSYYQNDLSHESLQDRPTILMLHGFSSDKVVWLRFARHFTDKYNVIIPDMAGHGKTGFKKNWDYKAEAQVNRLVELLDKLNIKKVHVIGNSMGGFFSAHFAMSYPTKILSATLVDPAGVVAPELSDMDKMLVEGKNPFAINNREEFDAFYAMTMNSPPWLPDYVFDFVSDKYQKQQSDLMQIFTDFHDQDMLDSSLDKIKAPVLLMWGDKDRLLDVSSVAVWQAGVGDLKVKIWQGIGHMPMFEIPTESAEYYQQFLNQLN
ncbi:MAG: alpha/beta hydrolase [Gammaproteobacteria bacterium]|nr:MAG: alpha/beta hydrolase [Gammaproteobacteria bacterium]